MLTDLIFFRIKWYHAICSLRAAGISFIAEQRLVDIRHSLQQNAERYSRGHQRSSGEIATEGMRVCRWTTFGTLL